MSILVDKKTRLVVQGITGSEGSFHTGQMVEYGTKVVAGVTPGKGGTKFEGIPIYNTVEETVKNQKANTSVIFVPPAFAADAILESANAGIKVIICVTEGIPTSDMVKVYNSIKHKDVVLVGPNCPGVISPGKAKVGIMPGFIHKKGTIGIVSRSGTLTYEAVKQIVDVGLGQSTAVGIGGDPIIGSKFTDIIKMFNEDPDTKGIVMIGEIGGTAEEEASAFIKKNVKKPVVGFITGFGFKKGAMASSIAHDSHNVIAVGVHDSDIEKVLNNVIKSNGGIAIYDGQNMDTIQLKIAGLMSDENPEKVARAYERINKKAVAG